MKIRQSSIYVILRYWSSSFVILAAALLAQSSSFSQSVDGAASESNPLGVIDALQSALIEAAAVPNLSLNERFELLAPAIISTHDLAYIAQVAIRRQWDGLSADHSARYLSAFEQLSVMTYAARFDSVTSSSFELISAEDGASGRAQVLTKILTMDGDAIPMNYVLHRVDGEWKIINIIADGVSDLALKRAEYRAVLNEGDIEDLIEELEKQVSALQAD